MSTETKVEKKEKKKSGTSTFSRMAKYTAAKLVMQFITVVIGIFLTIMIANMGGYVDQILKASIREAVMEFVRTSPEMKTRTAAEKEAYIISEIIIEEERQGLNEPFISRTLSYLTNAITLNLGRSINMTSDKGSKQVIDIIVERLPPTLLLMGTSNFIVFFGSLFVALAISRKYGSFVDKMVVALSPLSSAPSWFYGLFLILLFAAVLKVLPFGGMIDPTPPETQWEYALSVLKHLILPTMSLVISAMFISIYNWRTFFLIYSSEDYVEMAKAKGLSDRDVERKYILRPTLPNIITQFSLMLIATWTGAIITETVFQWPGLGRATFTAIGLYDTPVIVGITIIYAYLLALTVFFLDFLYALVDPRVKIGGN